MAELTREIHQNYPDGSPLPPIQSLILQNQEAPEPRARSFFEPKQDAKHGDPRLVTPTDEFSGLPLPLYPDELVRSDRFGPDLHHPIHPRRSPELQSLGGRALRNCRVQLAAYETHHYDYHQNFYGPALPDNQAALLRPVIFAAAGYIPENAIKFVRGEPKIEQLTHEQRSRLWDSRRIRVAATRPLQDFLREKILSQDLLHINDSTIDEFLHTNDSERRWVLGNEFLGRAALQATEAVKPAYREAFRSELIPRAYPDSVARFVLGQLGMRKHRIKLFEELTMRLASI